MAPPQAHSLNHSPIPSATVATSSHVRIAHRRSNRTRMHHVRISHSGSTTLNLRSPTPVVCDPASIALVTTDHQPEDNERGEDDSNYQSCFCARGPAIKPLFVVCSFCWLCWCEQIACGACRIDRALGILKVERAGDRGLCNGDRWLVCSDDCQSSFRWLGYRDGRR